MEAPVKSNNGRVSFTGLSNAQYVHLTTDVTNAEVARYRLALLDAWCVGEPQACDAELKLFEWVRKKAKT